MSKTKFTSLSIKKQDASNTVKFHVDEKNGVVVCRLYDRWYDTFHTAKTKVHGADKFSEKTGRAIAFNKARRKELEHNLAMIEAERAEIQRVYNEYMGRLAKREHINNIYLAGVQDELDELMGVERPDTVEEPVSVTE